MAPLEQWTVRREFLRRLKKAFDARGIEIPYPHVTVYAGTDKDGAAAPFRLAGERRRPRACPDPTPAETRRGRARAGPPPAPGPRQALKSIASALRIRPRWRMTAASSSIRPAQR